MREDHNSAKVPTSQDRVPLLWRQIKDHRVAQWSVGYVAVAYAILQGFTLTADALEWPRVTVRIALLLLALGLPLVATLAWYHGDRAGKRVSGLEIAIISLLLLVGISTLAYVFVQPSGRVSAPASLASQATPAPIAKPAGLSVAVLPFLNLSGDPQQEFFSDGMTEEITSALAKIPNLSVVGRTSAFTFKGKNEDLRKIGRALGAAYILEGSVRKDGNQVRITGQLIRAETGDHLWTENYDRELKGIFAVQEDVARAIAAALQVPLGLRQGETLVANRDIDPESYQNYLRAKALIRSRRADTALSVPTALLEQIVARHPDYAPAWASLAQAYALAPLFQAGGTFNIPVTEKQRLLNIASYRQAETAARHAIQLDPRNADAFMSLGLVQSFRGQLLNAEQSYQQALGIDPLNPDTLQEYSLLLGGTGQLKAAIAMREKLRSLEPLVPTFNASTLLMFAAAGDYARALPMAQALSPDFSARGLVLARFYAATGRYNDAADAALTVNSAVFPPEVIDEAVRLLRMAPASAAQQKIPYLGQFSFVFSYVGLPERVLEQAERPMNLDRRSMTILVNFWSSDFRIARKTARFKSLVRKAGLVDYWRVKGWPQYCRPTTGDDFACN